MLQICNIDTGQGETREKKAMEEGMVSDRVLATKSGFGPQRNLDKKKEKPQNRSPSPPQLRHFT